MSYADMFFSWMIRILTIYLTWTWFVYLTESDVPVDQPYSIGMLLKCIPQMFLIFGLGLWISTTRYALRYKFITCLLMGPTLLASPLLLGVSNTIIGWGLFIVIVACYFRTIFGGKHEVSI